MSAFTVRRKARFGGFRLGGGSGMGAPGRLGGDSAWDYATDKALAPLRTKAEIEAAQKAAAMAAQGFAPMNVSFIDSGYAPASMPDSSSYPKPTSTWKLPLIIGGVAVLGIGGFFLLRKKR